MADRGLSFTNPLFDSMNVGLRTPAGIAAGSPSNSIGLGNLAPNRADAAVQGERAVPGGAARRALQSLAAPSAATAQQFFYPETGQIYSGGRLFAKDDVASALAEPLAEAPPPPPGGVPLPAESYARYIQSFGERRTTGQLLGLGVRQAAEGIVGGVGAGLELAGATEVGPAIRGFAQEAFGQTQNEQLRSALIADNSTMWERVIDASIQSGPTLVSIIGTGGLVGAGLRAAGAGAAMATAGATAGATGASFPMHLSSFYDAAERNGYDLADPKVKTEVVGGAVANTLLDTFGPGMIFSTAFRRLAGEVGGQVARGALKNAAIGAGRIGFTEALTEGTQTLLESVVFDPEVRSLLSVNDLKALAPMIAERYGEDILVSMGAGAILGGGVGAAVSARSTPGQEVPADKPVDLNTTATAQTTEKEAAPGDLYGQQSFQPLGLPYIPGAETIGARPVAPTGGEQVIDLNRPLTLQQVGLMRGATQGLRPEDRAAGNITVPSGERAVTLEGEVLPPETMAAAPQAARLRAIGAPAAAPQLPPPVVAEADFTAGPEGVAPTAAPAAAAPAAPVTPGAQLRVGAAARPGVLPAPPQGAMADRLRAAMAARQQAETERVAETTAQEAATRAAQEVARQRTTQVEEAYAQREAQRATMYNAEQQAAYDQLTAEQKAYVDADSSWEQFRPQDGAKQSGVTLRDLAPKAQREWVAAVQQGTATQELYQKLRNRRPVGKAAPLVDVPTILQAAPEPEMTQTEPEPTPPKPTGKAKVQRKAAEPKAPKPLKVPKETAAPVGKPRAEAVTVTEVKRSPRGAAEPYRVVTLSDGRVIRIKHTGDKFTGTWTYLKTGDTIGEGIKADTAAERVAELASQGQLPDGVVDTPQDVAEEAPAVSAVEELEADINDFITVLESSTDKPARRAAISGLQDTLVDSAMTPALRTRVKDYLEELGTEAAATELTEKTGANTSTVELSLMINEFNAAPGEITGTWQTRFRQLVAAVRKEDPTATLGAKGPLLTSFAKANNDPNFARVDGTRQIISGLGGGRTMLANWNTIDGVVDLDGKPVTPVAPGRVQLLVRNFAAKLARAPKITVVRNQADLKAKNPQLYARAAAARPQGDFDTAAAMGYSFGDGQVIIFTDRIGTEQQLNFVLAHETLGHFGLRGIMPGPKFDALMESVYEISPAAKTAVDAAMSVRPGLSRAEAMEEYLSDYAAVLETSIMARVWNAIKGVLNKLGIRTGDEMVRYLLDQARRYARDGKGVTFDAQAFGQRLHSVETSGDTGRFSLGTSFRDVNLMAGLQVDSVGGYPMTIEEGWNYLKRQGVNSVTSWDKFKATFLSLSNFRSRQNPGSLALEKLLDEARNLSMATKVGFNERLALVLNRAIAGEVGGISDEQTQRVNQMLYAAQRYNVAQVQKIGDLGNTPLFRSVDGKLVPNIVEIARLKALGQRTLAQMRDGFEYDVTFEEAGKTVTKKEKFAGIKGLAETSIEWRGYQKIRDAMDDIELQLLEARYEGVMQERDLAFRQIAATVPGGELTPDERAALTTLAQTYGDLYTGNVQLEESGRAKLDPDYQTYANDILRTANAALLGRGSDRFDTLRELLTTPRQFMKGGSETDVRRAIPAALEGQVADDLIARLQAFKSRARLDENQFVVQNKVKQVILAELAGKDADKFTKRTIATGYTPVLREGAYQIRVEARVAGRIVRLQDGYREQLVYSQFASAAEAVEMKDRVNKMFRGNQFDVMYYDQDAGKYVEGKVELVAVDEAALDAVAAPPQLNLNEFIRGLRQFDIALTPDKMEDVIVALTKQNSAARNRLERVFTPGAQLDGVMATMRHIESRASTIAKIKVRPRLAELMDRSMSSTMALWNGDADHLAKLKKRAEDTAKDATMSREAKVDAQRAYEQYAYMYNQTNPEGQPRRGNQFYNESARTVAFLDGNQNVDESDFGSGPMVSRIRAATSMMQLGGSIATGALNVLSVYTNGVPYLSSYNAKTAFGGGFSTGKVLAELHRAAGQVGGPGITSGEMNTAEFYEKVSRDPALQKRYRLKSHEAAFIAREILDGAMIPAQSNALVGTARGRTTKGFQQKFLDGWMWTFNVTEQASRRSLGLTAYRLEFARKRATGMSEADAAGAAREFAVQALQYTMGEYSVLNRPPAWRSGIQSFIYMYKVFPTTSVQLFANMSRGGKVGMLAGLWLLTGLTGLPFAEDLEDLIDTLAQKLKIAGWQGARYETAQFIDEIFPGMSPLLLKGIVNNVMPADVAGRTSLGDLLPGPDILLAGADVSRGLSEIAGPAPAMLLGTAQFATDLLAVPFSTTTTLEGVAREAPVTMVRALADAYAYTQSGAVIDRRGYTVTDEMSVSTIITRALGFYPAAAANQYELIRSAKRMTDYQREVVTGFRTAWVSAMARGDRDFAREIEQSVEDWNDVAKGTALEINNFVKNSRRALQEAQRPAVARTLKSAPDAAEKDLQRMIDLMTLN
jgi:hypothetical protein